MSDPLVSQGVLNRLRASVIWPDFPALNVTASFLGEEGVRLALEGESTTFINTLTGAVVSPEPYMIVTVTINLLKTQSLSDSYKRQMETFALLGSCTVRPDTSTLSPYQFINCAIESVGELNFNGKVAGYAVNCKGYYPINSTAFTT